MFIFCSPKISIRDAFLKKVFLFPMLLSLVLAPLMLAPLLASESSSLIAPAPDVTWNQGKKIQHLSSLRGQPVLILMTDSWRNHAFLHQLAELEEQRERLAARGLVCLVAFSEEGGFIPSNIPFITLLHGADVFRCYGVSTRFSLALLGADGNLDVQSKHPLSGQRIDDLIDASFSTQQATRRP